MARAVVAYQVEIEFDDDLDPDTAYQEVLEKADQALESGEYEVIIVDCDDEQLIDY